MEEVLTTDGVRREKDGPAETGMTASRRRSQFFFAQISLVAGLNRETTITLFDRN